MTLKTKQEKQNSGFTAMFMCAALFFLAGCAQIESGRWYDSDSNSSRPTSTKTTKPAAKASPAKSTGESRVAQFWSRMRATLDRRPEAKKARAQKNRTSTGRKSTAANTKTANGLLVVGKGDTYYSLARQYDVPLRALLENNNAKPPYILSPGDRVRLPTQAFYEVKKKDTLYSISRAHKTDVATLAKLNGLGKPFTISVGQRLQIPGLQAAPVGASKAARVVAKTKTQPKTQPKTMPSAPKRVGRFLVPVKGSIISGYGPKDGGLHNDGINIAAREGAPIRAAENGVVVYTGNELRGYGNLLLIRHSGGWVTAYAHTSKFMVKPGARVKQGEVVAEVGRTGNVDRPQLHFELRKGTRAVNPQSLI